MIFVLILIGVPGEPVDGMPMTLTWIVVREVPALAAAGNSATTTSGMSRHASPPRQLQYRPLR